MAKFILDGQEYGGGGSGSNIVKLTQAEYDALSNDKLSNDIIYLITDSGELAAENLFYDGSQTGLGNNVQSAIDKLNSNLISKVGFIDTSNIIYETTGSTEWVATEDCFLVTQLYSNGDSSSIKIDDVIVAEFANPNTKCAIAYTSNFPIKKGQKVTLSLANTAPVFFYKMI